MGYPCWRRRWLSGMAVLSALITGCAMAAPDSGVGRQLIIMTWSEYTHPDHVAAFEAETGVTVRFVYYKSDTHRDRMVGETHGRGVDLMVVEGSKLAVYRKRDWIAPISADRIPNLRHIAPRWRRAYPAAETHAVPYFWGTLGIIYRRDLVAEPILSWHHFYTPDDPTLIGRMVLIQDPIEVVGTALLALGSSFGATDPAALDRAAELLQAHRPYVHSDNYLNLDEESAVVRGDVHVAMMYSGDGLVVQSHHPELVYVTPEDGTVLWIDYWCLARHAQAPDLAVRFIDFINEPSRAAEAAQYFHYPTPNQAAEMLLPASFRGDPQVYPPEDLIEMSERFETPDPRSLRRRNEIYSRIYDAGPAPQ